jgi:transposase
LFGISLIALAAYLKGRCHISYTALKDFFEAVLGIKISRGFLAKQVEKVSGSLKESYERLAAGLKGAPSINIDETGWKREGKKEWIWCFKTEKLAVFRVSFSRGHEVLKAMLGEEYRGIIICDFWGAYRAFKRISSCLLQFCWAHLIREIRFFVESPDKAVSRYGRRVLKEVRLMFQTIHQVEQMEHRVWIEQMQEHRKSIVKRILGTIPAHNDARKIAKRIQKWETDYFLFIDTGIAPTNNAGEQTIRQVVLDRKVTQGSRSEWGDVGNEVPTARAFLEYFDYLFITKYPGHLLYQRMHYRLYFWRYLSPLVA